ncbi:N/A [soil metagenome]
MRIPAFFDRLKKGSRWSWLSERHRDRLPPDLDRTVMDLQSTDRLHAKQGRSTCRVRFDSPAGPLSVYLKRHERLSWRARIAAWMRIRPEGRFTPAGEEWNHLRQAKSLGISVPEPIAVGEQIGPWGQLSGYLMVAELIDCLPLHEAIPARLQSLDPDRFESWKRALIAEMAGIVARLHRAGAFHKDLYLCHFYLDMVQADRPGDRLHLIDLHRLAFHRWTAPRWRRKDLGQLLFSTFGVPGIVDRDRLRFWFHYQRRMGRAFSRRQLDRVLRKSARYLAHNLGPSATPTGGDP